MRIFQRDYWRPKARAADLMEHRLAKRILWRDSGLLPFAPEGETPGKLSFWELLAVFSSRPLFKGLRARRNNFPWQPGQIIWANGNPIK
jgi:hypothetical protein